MSRNAEIRRTTGETEVSLSLQLDGTGAVRSETGVGFFDHMLEALGHHAGVDLEADVRGDLATGAHHTVEDTGLVLGTALDEALGDRAGIARFGQATLPMDEARVTAVVDVSGRPFTAWEGSPPEGTIAGFETDLAEEFFRALASAAKITLHVRIEAGTNPHHVVEACFKAVARALRAAIALEEGRTGVPSTKGLL